MNKKEIEEEFISYTRDKIIGYHGMQQSIDVLFWITTKIEQAGKQVSVEPVVMVKLADILQILDDEEYTVSVYSNDTVDDKISESIANTAIIDFKKQLKQELLSKFSA